MSFEQKDNSGALFKNDKKEGEQPDYRGPCMVNGQQMEMATWQKKSKKGKNFMSLSFKEPWEKKADVPEVKHPPDEVPF